MALQDIISKILEEARISAKEIERDYKEKSNVIRKDAHSVGTSELTAISKKGDKVLVSVSNKIDSLARREVRNLHQNAKREMVDEAMTKFVGFLVKSSDEDYKKILEKVYIGRNFSGTGKYLVPVNRKDISQSIFGSDAKVIESKDIKGGFVFVSKSLEIDMTFDSLVFSQYKNELEIYFGNQFAAL